MFSDLPCKQSASALNCINRVVATARLYGHGCVESTWWKKKEFCMSNIIALLYVILYYPPDFRSFIWRIVCKTQWSLLVSRSYQQDVGL